MSFFDDWGSQKNPVRQSDLNALFGTWGCQKAWAMAKLYPANEGEQSNHYKRVMGDLVHRAIWANIEHNQGPEYLQKLKSEANIQWNTNPEKEYKPYQEMIDKLFNSSEYRSFIQRRVDCERSFMMQLGEFWIAGTLDLVIENKDKDGLIVIDWKTAYPPMSQIEMDEGYQSNIYALAVRDAEFFLKPDDMSNGKNYYKSYQKTMQKNKYNVYPDLYFAYLKELIPAQKPSKRLAKHETTREMSDQDGIMRIEKGERRGPVFYKAKPNVKNIQRLVYALKNAVLKAQAGLFDEKVGPLCKRCHYREKCRQLGTAMSRKQQVLELMDEMGIEPT